MTQSITIDHWDAACDGALNASSMRRKMEALGYQVNRYVYPPGTRFPAHSHNVDKLDGVLSGRFHMTLYGQTLVLTAGDCIRIPKGAVHSAEVIGEQPVVSLDAIRQD